jgi:hypothetical protein
VLTVLFGSFASLTCACVNSFFGRLSVRTHGTTERTFLKFVDILRFWLEMNSERKRKYMLMSRNQKIGKKHSIKMANRSFEDVAKFRYLGTTLTDQNYVHEEIKSRLNSGNGC